MIGAVARYWEVSGSVSSGQADAPAQNRPLKPPRAGGDRIDQDQTRVDDDIAPQVTAKAGFSALLTFLLSLFFFELGFVFFNGFGDGFRIEPQFFSGEQ